jgi:hypothetical protein
MIIILIHPEARGVYPHTCEWSDRQYRDVSRTSPLTSLARQLIADGCPDQPWRVRDAVTGESRMSGGSLVTIAKLTISEDSRGSRFVDWKPFPDAMRRG